MDGLMQKEKVQQRGRSEKPDRTGIPGEMRRRFEANSGLSFQNVRVHYGSPLPERVQALAFTRGTQVYLGPGQERWLPHELGHVIQQKRGRVAPTTLVNGQEVNDSGTLEREADALGRTFGLSGAPALQRAAAPAGVIQRGGERDAVARTTSLRRGNRRGSVIETRGNSSEKLGAFRTWLDETLWPKFLAKFNIPKEEKDNLYVFVMAEATECVGVANCGEFAAVTYAYLADNGGGAGERGWIYYCCMEDMTTEMTPDGKEKVVNRFDHCFTMTSSDNYIVGLLDRNANLKEITVVDAWANYKICTLEQFCNKGNPYQKRLAPHNIRIEQKRAAQNRPTLTKTMKKFIQQQVADDFEKDYEPVDASETTVDEVDFFDFPRENTEIDDTRPNEVKILDMEESESYELLDSVIDNTKKWIQLLEFLPYDMAKYARLFLYDKQLLVHLKYILDTYKNVCFSFLDNTEMENTFWTDVYPELKYRMDYAKERLPRMDRKQRIQFLRLFNDEEWEQLVLVLSMKAKLEYALDLKRAGDKEHIIYILDSNLFLCSMFLDYIELHDKFWVEVYPNLLYRIEYAKEEFLARPEKLYQLLIQFSPDEWMQLVKQLAESCPHNCAEYAKYLLDRGQTGNVKFILKVMDKSGRLALWNLVDQNTWEYLTSQPRQTRFRPPAGPPDGSGNPPVKAGQPRSRPADVSTRQ